MIAPQLRSIGAFDATENVEIGFSVSGINSYTNKVIFTVVNNDTNEQVFEGTFPFYLSEMFFVLPPNSLKNEVYYKAHIQVVTQDDKVSPASNDITFFCEPKPDFYIVNLPKKVEVSSIQLSVFYANNSKKFYDSLQSYLITIYDSKGGVVYNSDTVYAQQELENIGKVSGLVEDNYKVIVTGYSVNGFELEYEQEFSVKFTVTKTFSAVELENLFDRGQIRISSNIVGLKGDIIGEEKYTDDGMIDLSEEGNKVIFQEGFIIEKDFYIKLWMKHIETNIQDNFLELSNGKEKISLRWRNSTFEDGQNISFVELLSSNGKLNYTIKSNSITDAITLDDIYFIGLKRINNLYQLKVYKVEG